MSVASCISQWHLVSGLSVQTRELHGDRGSGKNSMEKWGMWGSTQETIRFWQKSGSCYVKIGVGLRFWLGPRHTPLYWVCSIQCLPNSDSYGGSVASAEVCTRLSAILISALISMHLSRCLKQALVQMSTFPLILHESYEIFHNHPLQEGEIIGGGGRMKSAKHWRCEFDILALCAKEKFFGVRLNWWHLCISAHWYALPTIGCLLMMMVHFL